MKEHLLREVGVNQFFGFGEEIRSSILDTLSSDAY